MSSGIAIRSVVEPSMNSPGCRIIGESGPTSISSVEVLLRVAYVDDPLRVVAKHAKELVDVKVDRRRLDAVLAQGVNDDSALRNGFFDGAIGKDHNEVKIARSGIDPGVANALGSGS